MEVIEDHVHIFVEAPPVYSPAQVVQILKSVSAHRRPSVLRTEYQPQLIPSQNLQAVGEAVTDTSL